MTTLVNPDGAAPLLRISGLGVERGGRVVLADLSLDLAPGETVLVSGRNGAGKSTLLRTIAGLLHPAAGEIRYGLADEERRGVETIHYLGYEDALKPSLTVGENLEFWAAMLGHLFPPTGSGKGWRSSGKSDPLGTEHKGDPHPCPAPEGGGKMPSPAFHFANSVLTPAAALAAYGIARLIDLPAAYLSAGQKRRVALARLLLAPRPIWLLDEPLIALDVATQARTVEIMAAHTASGGAILVASHQPLTATREISLDPAGISARHSGFAGGAPE